MHDLNLNREIDILGYLLEQVEVVEEYISGQDEDLFLRDKKTKDAVLLRLMMIGEYGPKIDITIQQRFSEIDWSAIKKARNFYAHAYRGVDWVLVWNVVETELPKLKKQIEHIIAILEKENNGKTN